MRCTTHRRRSGPERGMALPGGRAREVSASRSVLTVARINSVVARAGMRKSTLDVRLDTPSHTIIAAPREPNNTHVVGDSGRPSRLQPPRCGRHGVKSHRGRHHGRVVISRLATSSPRYALLREQHVATARCKIWVRPDGCRTAQACPLLRVTSRSGSPAPRWSMHGAGPASERGPVRRGSAVSRALHRGDGLGRSPADVTPRARAGVS